MMLRTGQVTRSYHVVRPALPQRVEQSRDEGRIVLSVSIEGNQVFVVSEPQGKAETMMMTEPRQGS